MCRAVFGREVGYCPNGIELWLKVRKVFAPSPFIAVYRLCCLARSYSDNLSQVVVPFRRKARIRGMLLRYSRSMSSRHFSERINDRRFAWFGSLQRSLSVAGVIHVRVGLFAQSSDKFWTDVVQDDCTVSSTAATIALASVSAGRCSSSNMSSFLLICNGNALDFNLEAWIDQCDHLHKCLSNLGWLSIDSLSGGE